MSTLMKLSATNPIARRVMDAFNAGQPRDERGRWGEGGIEGRVREAGRAMQIGPGSRSGIGSKATWVAPGDRRSPPAGGGRWGTRVPPGKTRG
jgi:hypothetical protein